MTVIWFMLGKEEWEISSRFMLLMNVFTFVSRVWGALVELSQYEAEGEEEL